MKVNSRYRFAFLLQGKNLHDHVLTIRYNVEIRGTKKTHLTYSKRYKSALLSILLFTMKLCYHYLNTIATTTLLNKISLALRKKHLQEASKEF